MCAMPTVARLSADWAGPLQLARKHPLDEATVREQFSRLGETPFFSGSDPSELSQPVMVPKSVLNELRRTAVGRLAEVAGSRRAAD